MSRKILYFPDGKGKIEVSADDVERLLTKGFTENKPVKKIKKTEGK